MKKITLAIVSSIFVLGSNAQQIPALISDNNIVKIVKYNAETQTSTDVKSFAGFVQPNTMGFDNEDNKIIVLNSQNGQPKLESYSSINGNLLKSIPLNGQILGGVYIPSTKSYGVFSVITNFNGYGNNQEDISFVSIDVNTGRELFKVDMSSVSLSAKMLPFYGKSTDIINNKESESAISSLSFLPKLNQVIFCAKDVTGVNRIFRIDASTGKLVSRQSVYHNILDFAYNASKDELKAVAFESIDGKNYLYTLTLDQVEFKGSNIVALSNFDYNPAAVTTIEGTSIEFDLKNTYYITQPIQIPYSSQKTYLFSQDASNGEVKTLSYSPNVPQFQFGFEKSAFDKVSFLNAFKLYPNPTKGEITISTVGINITGIRVTAANGQLVKVIAVDGSFTDINLNLSELIAGVYFVTIENQGEPVIKRVVVQP
jgi:hypothetical protein